MKFSKMHLAVAAAATLAALGPAALFYAIWDGPAQAGLAQLALSGLLGAFCWLIALRLLRHPAYKEVVDLAGHLLHALTRRRPAPAA